jgi:endonuclease YncB( thermonuclease family)
MYKISLYSIITLILLISIPAQATDLSGTAKVKDGRTLTVNGTTFELYGIDAVELDQVCQTKRKKDFPCGHVAATALAAVVRNVIVKCRPEGPSEPVLKMACIAGPMDVAELLVLQGWAFADPKTGEKYQRAERAARMLNEGIWKGLFDYPWDWRKQHR